MVTLNPFVLCWSLNKLLFYYVLMQNSIYNSTSNFLLLGTKTVFIYIKLFDTVKPFVKSSFVFPHEMKE